LLYDATMAAKPVQISIDSELLDRIDADPETRTNGRSAFVRTAVEHYLARKRRGRIEAQIADAYGGQADAMLDEVSGLIDAQAWPDE
jgi:predicted transcriptional regulator